MVFTRAILGARVSENALTYKYMQLIIIMYIPQLGFINKGCHKIMHCVKMYNSMTNVLNSKSRLSAVLYCVSNFYILQIYS